MAFELPPLPYSHGALAERGMCQETLELHHDKHHQAYVTALNGFVEKNSRATGQVARRDHQAEQRQGRHGAGVQQCRPAFQPHPVLGEHVHPKAGTMTSEAAGQDRERSRWRAEVQGRLQDRRNDAVRLRLGVVGAGQRRQVEDHQDAERQQSAGRHGRRRRRCSDWTCGSTATTWTSSNRRPDYVSNWLDKIANYEYAESKLK